MEPLVLTEERLELFDLGMAFGNAVQYPPVFSWCGIVESKEAHTLHMAKEEIFIRFITLKFSAYYLSKGLCGILRHLIVLLGQISYCAAESESDESNGRV